MAASSGVVADADADVPWTAERLEQRGVRLRIVNMLVHGSLREPIDVKRLALLGFNALVLRFRSPRATLLVYRSGKFLVVGAASLEDARAAKDKFIAILHKVDFPSDVRYFDVANVVGAADARFKVRLEGLARAHSRFCTYEPELFPGLIYRMLKPKCTLLVFVSGKIVVTGCKEPSENQAALAKMYPVLLQFRLRAHAGGSSDESESESE